MLEKDKNERGGTGLWVEDFSLATELLWDAW